MEKPSQTLNNPVEEAPPTKRRKTMARFTDELDFQLIQKAQARNPYGEDYGKKTQAWADVAAALEVDLVDAYEAKQKASEKRSGPCEEYTPKDECLAELLELREIEALLKNDKKQPKDQQQQEDEQASAMRDAALEGMSRGGGKGGSQQQQLVAYLERRDQVAQALEGRKVANEEKRLALEERRLELQELRMELERDERLAFY
ncbi:hypothetical protein PHYSODRAFT_322347 [Phytophthora sojae]|uniref:MADF domain-containing protein n=1 Tax=Phytophthora sojae (strain P6497) TaxID=1094619 RepID=G4YGA0_PHYSP|nr:hypothetical protein PHYSODRAFT_322347 [Phytophthora sojae]EGZ28712.1 hypothetical protein PHYSODRAFT_322347 [Phytophthora sojae]|eukprot:XP_009515987.1 hypothetical protein PHYSODRAFT_322347 [Phytophthora sojae]